MQAIIKELNDLIKVRGRVSWLEVKNLCENGHFGKMYKVSCVERRLRKSESPEVETVMENGHIAFYRWLGSKPREITYRVLDHAGNTEKTFSVSYV